MSNKPQHFQRVTAFMQSALHAIACPSLRLSVCLSVRQTGHWSVKNGWSWIAPSLQFLQDKIHPGIPSGSVEQACGGGN